MLSVIIPAYNVELTIPTQLEALAKQQCSDRWEIIVADNGSSDRTRETVQQYQKVLPNLRLVDASARQGSGYARNCAARHAQGEYLLFCDADDEVAPGWLAAMSTALAHNDFVCGLRDHTKLNSDNDWHDPLSQIEGYGLLQHPYLPFAAASNLGVKRAIHEAVGGFNEQFLALQDIDYCWRIQEMGHELREVSDAIVYFRFRQGVESNYKRLRKFGYFTALLHYRHLSANFPKWFIVKCSWSLLLVPIKFIFRVRNRDSLFLWYLNAGWSLGYWQGWVNILQGAIEQGFSKKSLALQK
jgi:glycosyltransferase involved in cell wall biosynthesis